MHYCMANHFCTFVLYDCACDMDHESVINQLLLLLYGEVPRLFLCFDEAIRFDDHAVN